MRWRHTDSGYEAPLAATTVDDGDDGELDGVIEVAVPTVEWDYAFVLTEDTGQ